MIFPEMNSVLRTDDTFKQMSYKSHHRETTPLTDAGINCVSDMVLDYMHLVCLGEIRRLIILWIWSPLKCRQSHSMVFRISDHLAHCANLAPAEFVRKPRSLLEVKRWKATEFRQFLFYTRSVVLLGNFQCHYTKTLCCCLLQFVYYCLTLCAKELLQNVVQHFSKIYDSDMVVYNIQNLIHLPDDAMKHGSLEKISAFPFKVFMSSFLRQIKNLQSL